MIKLAINFDWLIRKDGFNLISLLFRRSEFNLCFCSLKSLERENSNQKIASAYNEETYLNDMISMKRKHFHLYESIRTIVVITV